MEMTEQQIDAIKNAEAPAREAHSDATPEGKDAAVSAPTGASSESAAADASDAAAIAASLAEAEERGYRRGREEVLAEIVTDRGMWQAVGYPASPAGRMTRAADGFLSGLRPGVWER